MTFTKALSDSIKSRFLRFWLRCSRSDRDTSKHSPAPCIDCCRVNELAGAAEPDKRVAEFRNAAPRCHCETSPASTVSPHCVDSEELLSRFIFSPIHVNKHGKPKASAFSHVTTRGCSVQREGLASNQELLKWLAAYRTSNPGHSLLSVASAKCADVRALRFSKCNERSVAVYDTAIPENAAHAELMQTEHGLDESDDIETRRQLLTLFTGSPAQTRSEYRQGLLSH